MASKVSTKIALLAGVAAVSAGYASAQASFYERNRYVSVTERAQPEYDSVPIRLGAFEARPAVYVGAGYRTNLFASSTNETEDSYLLLRPTVNLQSTWSRHSLAVSLSSETTEYNDTSSESSTDLRGRISGRVDASSTASLVGNVIAENIHEPRSSVASNPAAVEPVEYSRLGGEVGADYVAGRVKIRGRLSSESFDYEDVRLNAGPMLDQDFRDRDETSANVRVAYAPQRDWAVFVEGIVTERDYDAPVAPSTLNRDSQDTVIRVGSDFELPFLVRGDVAVGYFQTEFDDSAFGDIDGLSVAANASWFVTQLTTVTGSASRSVVDPGLQTAAGATQTDVSVRVDHELRRNWLINATLGMSDYDYENINRTDERIRVRLGTEWKLNRNASLNASYDYFDQDSNQQPFSENRVLVGVTLRP
ncbi:outer membrane beta-barrel protein [Henriciella sp. AS95]|uniref:outer membrane beta-barrel protein n=1 Tax=Henriciella sp. AS95 TaxID=3135782 RepID=UPI0031805620